MDNMDHEARAREALRDILARFGKSAIADEFSVNTRTIERWEKERIPYPSMVLHAIRNIRHERTNGAGGARNGEGSFTFIDLFAGIGGIRLGFDRIGGNCIFSSEWDRFCRSTYNANFEPDHPIHGDIKDAIREDVIPDHDVLVAGFPCQPFSIAGVSKKNSLGRAHGFACEAQGTLFFDVATILKEKRPAAFMLENVKSLKGHDKGRTYEVIMHTLREELGYQVYDRVIDAQHFVPQHRERIIIVGFREPTAFSWNDLELPSLEKAPRLGDILQPEDEVDPKYTLSRKLWKYLQDYADKHRAQGNGFGFGLVGPTDIARTLSARYYKDGSEILVSRGPRRNPRRLTPRECARLMGFDDSFRIPVSDTQAYKQFGNSVAVPVIEEVARIMYPHIMAVKQRTEVSEGQLAMVV